MYYMHATRKTAMRKEGKLVLLRNVAYYRRLLTVYCQKSVMKNAFFFLTESLEWCFLFLPRLILK